MEQQRRNPASAQFPAASSPLLGLNDDFYELLQSTPASQTAGATSRFISGSDCGHIAPGALKMEPELGDFMGTSSSNNNNNGNNNNNSNSNSIGASGAGYAWTAPGMQAYNNIDNSFAALTNFTQQLPDVTPFFASYTSPPPPVVIPSPAPQIQALRDFMVYGSSSNAMVPSPPFSSAMSSRATTPQGLYNALDEGTMDGMHAGGAAAQLPSLAYRALCNEIYATERSPHRSQFQRENHILAERQRREEMNEKFSALRAMIPKATKKDKASIVGDTIDYVLELEKRLKQLQACKDTATTATAAGAGAAAFGSKGGGLKRKAPHGSSSRGCEDAGTSSETTTTTANAALANGAGNGNANGNASASASAGSPARGGDSGASSPSEHVTAESPLSGKAKEAVAEVDVQQLGTQAVVKVVCNRRRGHVLRVLSALESECKVEVLQSNVMSVAENSIHFVTVQLEEGVSAPTAELISTVLQAINSVET